MFALKFIIKNKKRTQNILNIIIIFFIIYLLLKNKTISLFPFLLILRTAFLL